MSDKTKKDKFYELLYDLNGNDTTFIGVSVNKEGGYIEGSLIVKDDEIVFTIVELPKKYESWKQNDKVELYDKITQSVLNQLVNLPSGD